MPGEGNLGDAKFILKNGIKMPAVGCKSKYCYWMLFNLYFIKLLKFAFLLCKIKSYSNLLSRRLTSKYENVKIKTLAINIFISFIT